MQAEYEYDGYDRLTLEYNYNQNRAYGYEYDSGGNILSKKYYYIVDGVKEAEPYATDSYGYTADTNPVYGHNALWKDQLKSYNGEKISYDGAGNPTAYRGKAITGQGRQLKSIDDIGYGSFTGDSFGIGNNGPSLYYVEIVIEYGNDGNGVVNINLIVIEIERILRKTSFCPILFCHASCVACLRR